MAEIAFLSSFDIELPTFTGFSSAEIDFMTATPHEVDGGLEAVGHVLQPEMVVTRHRRGHKLGCLDALGEASFALLMGEERAGLVISDAPDNVSVRSHVTRRADAREFAMASGEMSPEAFTAFLATSFRHSAAYARDGSFSLQFMDWRHITEMMAAGKEAYGELFNLAVWTKTNSGMGSPWRSGHELCFVWKRGTAPHIDNIGLGRVGRNPSNVWAYSGARRHRDQGSEGRVMPKNLAMIQDAILDVSNRGDIVLDAFVGSGTTLVAAHLAHRRGYGLEIDPIYVDLAVRRMEARTKASARHVATGLTFAEMAGERGVSLPSTTFCPLRCAMTEDGVDPSGKGGGYGRPPARHRIKPGEVCDPFGRKGNPGSKRRTFWTSLSSFSKTACLSKMTRRRGVELGLFHAALSGERLCSRITRSPGEGASPRRRGRRERRSPDARPGGCSRPFCATPRQGAGSKKGYAPRRSQICPRGRT